MAPLPKKKMAKSRSLKRKNSQKPKKVNFNQCPNCHKPILPHTLCQNCGQYKGQEVIKKKAVKTVVKKK